MDIHGLGLLSLCFGWPIPKRMVVDPWLTGFTVFSFMVIYLFHHPFCWKGWEITMKTGALAGDYHNEMRGDHQEL